MKHKEYLLKTTEKEAYTLGPSGLFLPRYKVEFSCKVGYSPIDYKNPLHPPFPSMCDQFSACDRSSTRVHNYELLIVVSSIVHQTISVFFNRVGIRNHRQLSVSGTDGAHDRSIYNAAMRSSRLDVNQTSNDGKKDLQNLLTYPSEKVNQHHGKNPSDDWHQTKRFSLIQPRSTTLMWNRSDLESIHEMGESCCERLESGMVLLKNHVSLSDQVEIVNICQEFGVGPGGFYQPCLSNGAKLRLQMMCFGRNWDPQTKYNKRVRSDGSEAPPLPDKLISLSETALDDSRACLKSEDEIPSMYPDICIVNFYTSTGRLGLHQDRDESSFSLKRGLPVVSISIGDAAEFLYGDTRDVEVASKVLLESGDVLIFGGKSRHVFHGVKKIIPDSAPLPLLKQTMLRPGRLNLTFREF